MLKMSLFAKALFACTIHLARAWNFTITDQPEVCIGIELAFSGGSPPYNFTFLHPPDVPHDQIANLSAWSSGIDSSWTLNETYPDGGYVVGDNHYGFTPLIIVASDATGFASGGTTQAYTVMPEQPPLLPGCDLYPGPNISNYLRFLDGFSTNLTECDDAWIQIKNRSLTGSEVFWIDTVVPLGQSFRNTFDSSIGNGTYSWPLNLAAGTNVTFAYSDTWGNSFVTPIMTVQASNSAACHASGTLSASPTTLPTVGSTQGSAAQRMIMGSAMLGALVGIVVMVLAGTLLL